MCLVKSRVWFVFHQNKPSLLTINPSVRQHQSFRLRPALLCSRTRPSSRKAFSLTCHITPHPSSQLPSPSRPSVSDISSCASTIGNRSRPVTSPCPRLLYACSSSTRSLRTLFEKSITQPRTPCFLITIVFSTPIRRPNQPGPGGSWPNQA